MTSIYITKVNATHVTRSDFVFAPKLNSGGGLIDSAIVRVETARSDKQSESRATKYIGQWDRWAETEGG